jgi:mannosyltransferase OCH1-like enzyme
MFRRKSLNIFLSILALFLLGTVVVLSSITYYLAIDPSAYLSELEVPHANSTQRWNATEHGQIERIPRIIHQTWKTENIPDKWKSVSQSCRSLMPDYDYKLWTDESSRDFISDHYPWFLDTFDNYPYNIQRADAIRYFVLHYYGGIYIDLDIGCLRPADQLLVYPVILPKTIPVGVSNDLMFSAKGHPFLEQTIHNLATFDHSWILNYPTVMFTTGPMFLSILYALYTTHHTGDIRILPKALYGKNALEGEAPHSFFSHFYGSSWHADDAAFIGFLGTRGKILMWIGLMVLIAGVCRVMLVQGRRRRYFGRIGRYDVLLPRWSHRTGSWQFGWSTLPAGGPTNHHQVFSSEASDCEDDGLLHFDIASPTSSENTEHNFPLVEPTSSNSMVYEAVQRLRNRVTFMAGASEDSPRNPVRSRRSRSRGVLFFLPAIFHQPDPIELEARPQSLPVTSLGPDRPSPPMDLQWPAEKCRGRSDLESAESSREARNRSPRPLIDIDDENQASSSTLL